MDEFCIDIVADKKTAQHSTTRYYIAVALMWTQSHSDVVGECDTEMERIAQSALLWQLWMRYARSGEHERRPFSDFLATYLMACEWLR